MNRVVAACAVLGLTLGSASGASAATIAVTVGDDVLAADGQCSLREAITAANNDSAPFAGAGECVPGSGADTVVLPAGSFKLTLAGAKDDSNAIGDLDVLGTELTIAGAGAALTTIDANALDRAIDVRTGRNATIRDLTVIGGSAPGGTNGGNSTGALGESATGGAGNPGEPGGGIRNLGTLTVLDSTISGNAAGAGGNGGSGHGGNGGSFSGFGSGGRGGDGGAGGGIFNSGVLTVTRSTVTGNTAGSGGTGGFGQGGQSTGTNGMGGLGTGGTGGNGGQGGGIAAGDATTTTDQASSISGNAAGAGGDGGLGQGGAGGLAGFMSSATGGTGGQGGGGPGGFGGGGGGISSASSLNSMTATAVLIEGNAGGAGGDGGNGNGSVGGAAIGTGNGGNGGNGNGSIGREGGPGGGLLMTAGTVVAATFSGNVTGAGGKGGNGTGGGGGGAAQTGAGGNGGVGDAGSGGSGSVGGALSVGTGSTIRHATITSNQLAAPGGPGTATGGPAGQGSGGAGSVGIAAPGSPGSAGSGGGVFSAGATLANSVLSGNAAPSCDGSVTDGQHNIVFPDAGCPGVNVDPQLGALADNGGPTKTQAVGPGSPAFDAVPPAACSPTDQRGVSRPQGAGCEAGAYEFAPPSVVTGQATATSASTATLEGAVTPNARTTSYHFEIGTTTAYGRSTPVQGAGAGTAAVAVQESVNGLASDATYHYRLVATNAEGTSAGEDRTLVIPDSVAPRFLSASLAPKVFAVNRRGPAETPVAAQRRRRGTTFRYTLSEPARVLFTISRARPGRRVGRRCVKPTRRNRARRKCTRYVLVRRFAAQAGTAPTRKKFSGRIGRRSLKPGRYRATLTARDAAGNVSAPRRLRFRVVR